MPAPRAVAFFGCWTTPGHFLYDATGRTLVSFGPFVPESLDNTLIRDRGRGFTTVTCFKDYTVLAFEDFTVDKRGGCNGAFIVEGYALTHRELWEAAEAVFPQVVRRLHGHVRGADIREGAEGRR